MIRGHGGNIQETATELGCSVSDLIDMSSNLNPLGPMPGVIDHLQDKIPSILTLPDADSGRVASAVASFLKIPDTRILAGNGTTQFIHTAPLALGTRNALVVGPTYADYADACDMYGAPFEYFLNTENTDFEPDLDALAAAARRVDTVFICNPNNPTGTLISKKEMQELAGSAPDTWFVVDETYMPFALTAETQTLVQDIPPNVLVLCSISKIHTLPGLRIGFLVAQEPVIEKMMAYYPPWSVNSIAQEAIFHLTGRASEMRRFMAGTRTYMADEKQTISDILTDTDIDLYPGHGPFVLCRVNQGYRSGEIKGELIRQKIMVRDCSNFIGLDDRFIRFSLRHPDQNRHLGMLLKEMIPAKQGNK